jgi:hypothetical protein
MAEKIKYLGLKNLDSFEIAQLNSLTEKFYPKIERKVPDAILTVHVKTLNREGKKKTYDIKLKLSSRKIGVKSVHQPKADWDLARALHKTFNNLANLVNSCIKPETRTRKKSFKE